MVKQMRVGVKAAWIIGLLAIAGIIIKEIFFKPKAGEIGSQTQKVGEQKVDSGIINNYNAGGDLKVENNTFNSASKKDTGNKPKKETQKSQPRNQIVNNAPNHGVQINENNGVVVVPGEMEIPNETNYSIVKLNASDEGQRYEFKPKQGAWNNAFFAYPLDEEPVVKGDMGSKFAGVFFKNFSEETFSYNSQEVRVKVYSTNQQVNRDIGVVFNCLKSPSILFFGDFSNPQKQYMVKRLQ